MPGTRDSRHVAGIVLIAGLVFTSSIAILGSGPAGANQVGNLRAQARAISQKLVQEQLEIDGYQQQYSVASAKVAADARAIAAIDQQLGQDQQQFAADTRQVRDLALSSYMSGGALTGADASLFIGNTEEVQSANEYDAIATGNIETALDQLQSAQDALQIQQASLRQQQATDEADATQQSTALGQAHGAEDAMESEQSLVTGQLAAAVTAQTDAQDAAAAAAVAAAQKAGAKAPGHGAKPGSGVAPATGSASGSGAAGAAGTGATVSDPALPPFLQCVVQAESGGNYGAVSPGGTYMGAFQFSQSTWNFAAQAAGLGFLVGVPPNQATKPEQDTVAVALYSLDGERPWLGDRCSS
jgi:hypothetical protein